MTNLDDKEWKLKTRRTVDGGVQEASGGSTILHNKQEEQNKWEKRNDAEHRKP